MISLLRSGASLLIAATLTILAVPSRADELLVMPYACAIVGGQPVLTPSRDEGHRVIGPREQRTFTACSPVNPDMCRRWTLYRFDVNCGGVRVPWVSVAVAVDRLRGTRQENAWIENGQLHLPMPPRWNMTADDPCARWSNRNDRWRDDRFNRYCADRRAMAPPATVEMPVGFAPMLGVDGIFVPAPGGGGEPVAAAPPAPGPAPSRVARAEPPQLPPTAPQERLSKDPPVKSQPPARAETQPAAVAPPKASTPSEARDGPVIPRIINRPYGAPSEAPQPAARESASSKAAALAPDAPPKSKPTPEKPPLEKSPEQTASGDGPVIPKIINGPNAAANEAPPPAPQEVIGRKPQVAATAAAPPKNAAPAPEPPGSMPEGNQIDSDRTISVSLVNAVSSPLNGALAALGITLLLLTAFAVQRWRDRAQNGAAHPRDFASVSLDGNGGQGRALTVAPDRGYGQELTIRPQQAPPAKSSAHPAFGDTIPRTREEALEVLGMGVTRDANDAAIKKIVDGLRQSWHPDLATDATDRQTRELRLKQINAAWDIISRKDMSA